jgi:LmbE family N-acetylglucosaminyl deacetylase
MRVIVVAPHPDDETLGCGGTLLRHRADGDELHWLIVTRMDASLGYTAARIARRDEEEAAVARHYRFAAVHRGGFIATRLDAIRGDVVKAVATIFNAVQPETVYLPFRTDVHTDHRVVYDSVAACTKWFRHGSVRRVLAYETPSETEFGLSNDGFNPNVFVDISAHLDGKVQAMKLYAEEIEDFPFPRSVETIRSLAAFRGSSCGCTAAEAFVLLREIR